ncbi:MAG TPA: hypothetical protein PK529_05790 [Verrucomicrobiales bacterium]|nr:hypothetical protein [Verrucomicrobiales bacterium]
MTKYLPVFAIVVFSISSTASPVQGGGGGYPTSYHNSSCADSKFQTPRYHQLLPYRHWEDRARYNAAPCCGEVVRIEPYLLKTVVVSKRRIPHYTYDANGNRRSYRALTVTYKDLYSDGSCYVWTEQG